LYLRTRLSQNEILGLVAEAYEERKTEDRTMLVLVGMTVWVA